jgi:glucose uptake protein
MILPSTYSATLLLLIVSMLCWGSWANTQKLAGKWRFELFYYDYSLGVLLCAIVAAFTFGSWLPKELTFQDNFLIASRTQMIYGVAAGVVFNLANMLLVAAIAVAGMAVAFPIAIGLALVIGVIWNFALNPQGNPFLLFGGAALIIAAIMINAFAYSSYIDDKNRAALPKDPRLRPKAPPRGAAKGIILSLAGGILMGMFYPLVELGKQGELGVSPYGIALLFAAGVVLSSLLYVPFFLNFPVQGQPIQQRMYLTGTRKQHLLGILGGLIWMTGAICNFVAASAPSTLQVGPAISYALGQGATLISTLWGLLVWHEFKGASGRVRILLAVMIVVFVSGLVLISIAPLSGTK